MAGVHIVKFQGSALASMLTAIVLACSTVSCGGGGSQSAGVDANPSSITETLAIVPGKVLALPELAAEAAILSEDGGTVTLPGAQSLKPGDVIAVAEGFHEVVGVDSRNPTVARVRPAKLENVFGKEDVVIPVGELADMQLEFDSALLDELALSAPATLNAIRKSSVVSNNRAAAQGLTVSLSLCQQLVSEDLSCSLKLDKRFGRDGYIAAVKLNLGGGQSLSLENKLYPTSGRASLKDRSIKDAGAIVGAQVTLEIGPAGLRTIKLSDKKLMRIASFKVPLGAFFTMTVPIHWRPILEVTPKENLQIQGQAWYRWTGQSLERMQEGSNSSPLLDQILSAFKVGATSEIKPSVGVDLQVAINLIGLPRILVTDETGTTFTSKIFGMRLASVVNTVRPRVTGSLGSCKTTVAGVEPKVFYDLKFEVTADATLNVFDYPIANVSDVLLTKSYGKSYETVCDLFDLLPAWRKMALPYEKVMTYSDGVSGTCTERATVSVDGFAAMSTTCPASGYPSARGRYPLTQQYRLYMTPSRSYFKLFSADPAEYSSYFLGFGGNDAAYSSVTEKGSVTVDALKRRADFFGALDGVFAQCTLAGIEMSGSLALVGETLMLNVGSDDHRKVMDLPIPTEAFPLAEEFSLYYLSLSNRYAENMAGKDFSISRSWDGTGSSWTIFDGATQNSCTGKGRWRLWELWGL